jgi:hypothetical protein
MRFKYLGHSFEASGTWVSVPFSRMGDSRTESRPVIVCHGPHGWDADAEQPTNRQDARQILRYRIAEGITGSHQGSRNLKGNA